jgi:type I restriction enzyme M protein
LRSDAGLKDEMEWVYKTCGEDVYSDLKKHREKIESHLSKNDIKLKPVDSKNLLDIKFWKNQLQTMQNAQKLADTLGHKQFDNYNTFIPVINKTIKDLRLDINPKSLKNILAAITWKNEEAEKVIKKKERDGAIIYEADSDLRDSENVPLDQDIQEYFKREVLVHIPDAWIDQSKTVKGYEISFTRYFYNYVAPRSLEEITAEILALEKETDGILKDIVSN